VVGSISSGTAWMMASTSLAADSSTLTCTAAAAAAQSWFQLAVIACQMNTICRQICPTRAGKPWKSNCLYDGVNILGG
jgi:hypothetical protein